MATTYAVHIGVRPEDVNYITVLQQRLGNTVTADGDGWNAWGEKPGTDDNDETTRHLIVGPFEHFVAAEWTARGLHEQRHSTLVPMGGHEKQRDTRVVVTEWDDWSLVRLAII
jgi:hypothetical protein